MNTSTNETEVEIKKAGGAFADGLTLIRLLLTPVVMYLIIAKGWPSINTALLVSALFAIAALTDIFDDLTGGAETSAYRKFGWFDDIADSVLMMGTLAAMLGVFFFAPGENVVAAGKVVENIKPAIPWLFVIPAAIIIGREIIVGLVKGFELSRVSGYENTLGNLKTAFIMFGTCLLLASPWLTSWFSELFGKAEKVPADFDVANNLPPAMDNSVFDSYLQTTNFVWNGGLAILWIGAILSVITGFTLLTRKVNATNDG